eukprot:UN03597
MPHMIIRSENGVENGPTIFGDEGFDPFLVDYLGGKLVQIPGSNNKVYQVHDCPRVVLDKMERMGYVASVSCFDGKSLIWTLRKLN